MEEFVEQLHEENTETQTEDYKKRIEELEKELKAYKELLMQFTQNVYRRQELPQQNREEEEEDEELKKLKEDYPDVYKAVKKIVEKKTADIRNEMTMQSFYTQLSALVPDWKILNTDPEFVSWLQQPSEEIPSKTRHQLMLEAFNKLDVDTVASFFQKYKQIKQTNRRIPSATGRTADMSAYSMQPTGKVWKESEIRKFYMDVAMGKYKPDQKEKIENEILLAMKDGRVKYGE